MAAGVGVGSFAIGAVLVANPAQGRLIAIDYPPAARVIGLLDLCLAPGLVYSTRPRQWLMGRIALNAAIAGYVVFSQRSTGRQARASATAMGLAAVTIVDIGILRQMAFHRGT